MKQLKLLTFVNFFANNLKLLRKQKRLNQTEVSLSLGLKRNTISNYETSHSEPDLETLQNIASFFDISIDQLVTIEIEDVHLNGEGEGREKTNNVHPNVHPNVHLKAKKGENLQLSELLQQVKKQDKIIATLSVAVNSMEATNSRLLEEIERLKLENNRLKKEIPQIGQEMGGANTQTA